MSTLMDVSEYEMSDYGVTAVLTMPNPDACVDGFPLPLRMDLVRTDTRDLVIGTTLDDVVGSHGSVYFNRVAMRQFAQFTIDACERLANKSIGPELMAVLMSSISTVHLRRFETHYRRFLLVEAPAVEPSVEADRAALVKRSRDISGIFLGMMIRTGQSALRGVSRGDEAKTGAAQSEIAKWITRFTSGVGFRSMILWATTDRAYMHKLVLGRPAPDSLRDISATKVLQIHAEWVKKAGLDEMFDHADAARLADFVLQTPNVN